MFDLLKYSLKKQPNLPAFYFNGIQKYQWRKCKTIFEVLLTNISDAQNWGPIAKQE